MRQQASFAPSGWHSITPRIVVVGARDLVQFLVQVFDAEGTYEADRPAVMQIGDSRVMVSEAGVRPPMPAFLYVYVEHVESTWQRAVARGARVIEPPLDTPYGDRRAMFEDRWGNTWQVARAAKTPA